MRDELFQQQHTVEDFTFTREVAAVFDDMVQRSVPFYQEIQRMTVELVHHFHRHGGRWYDLGCSTGTTIAQYLSRAENLTGVIGVDASLPMVEEARRKVEPLQGGHLVSFWTDPIEALTDLPDASVVTILFTLQFLRPLRREEVLRTCFRSLAPGGAVVLGEKILPDNPKVTRLFIEHYHALKARNGYSEGEIARKREALENVLIPFRASENIELLSNAGFSCVEQVFRWYNFALYLAIK
jgi:tRNA (cmo5U34)-methyltransferase